jgi:hypothetical protein
MALDAVRPDGKTDANPPMSGVSGFISQGGKPGGVVVLGDAWDAFFKLKELVASEVDKATLDRLDNSEIRNFKTFRIVLDMAGAMTTETMRQHVLAYWRAIKEGILKLPSGGQVAELIKVIDGGAGVR